MADLIDRAAVAAFLKGYWGSIGGGMPEGPADEAILNTITAFETAIAALPEAPQVRHPQGVRVKPLVWTSAKTMRVQDHFADDYIIRGNENCLVERAGKIVGSRLTLDAAKAAAQADYERRILAALEPAEAGGVEANAAKRAVYDRTGLPPVVVADRSNTAPRDDLRLTLTAPAPDAVEALVEAAEALFGPGISSERDFEEALERLRAALAAIREGRG
jgi:hypothetical protein